MADISVVDLLTTEALRRPMEGDTPGLQISLQYSTRLSGLVAHLTSVRPWAQAEEDTSQRKAKAAVTTRSWQGVEQSNTETVYIHINIIKTAVSSLCM